ncbi:hypothetical protein HALLA_08290 [Halostagnicola larsenii XH-48]|uniref:Cadherin domain-containing protein n=1 Tax=Halostagnicola larsenii XH-48 TaxID=797299 RepID=W0JJU1_9EURY|nr:hypothetical protein [Halostagnicola larsenii]AHF98863.1 hypothetical protein HALLA_08290 [Halostagnicola larsenii XH-48]
MSHLKPAVSTVIAVSVVLSVVALPFLGGGLSDRESMNDAALENVDDGNARDRVGVTEFTATEDSHLETVSMASGPTQSASGPPQSVSSPAQPISGPAQSATAAASLTQEGQDAVEAGVEEGIELAQSQGVEITAEQRAAALEGANASAGQYQEADAEQIQAATAGAVHGSLMQAQAANATQVQAVVSGATEGTLSQSQTVNASQMQSATWGAAHGAIAHHQRVTVEQLQVASFGAATGAAASAGETGVDRAPKIQEAAQGSAYGVLEQYQTITTEQRQRVTLEHVQSAAAGAAGGALEGSTEAALEGEQRLEVEQRQEVTIKQIQKAATGAAKGALVQQQEVSVEQTQAAAHGAAMGPLKQLQTVSIEQVQRISITQVHEASFGAATGAIVQSQEASVEQIQAAADGSAQGVLVQQQAVSITQIQAAATGAATGALDSAIQRQTVEIEQVQAAAFGAGEGAVRQTQVVDIVQVQTLAEGASSGALGQSQEASIEQVQIAASSACQEIASAIQSQQISVSQLQLLAQETASDAVAYAVAEGIDDESQIVQYVEIEVVQRVDAVDELEGNASISTDDQNSTGETVTVDNVSLSEGGFVAVYGGLDIGLDPEGVIGNSEYLESGDHEDVEIELNEPLSEDGPVVAAVHHDTTGEETFQYVESDGADDEPYVAQGGTPVADSAFITLEGEEPEPPAEPEATLSVSDQDGDGETLLVEEANASVEYAITAEYGNETAESDAFEANESVTNETLDLEPPIEENTTVDVSIRDVENETELANESIEYTLEDDEPDPPDEPEATLEVADQTGNGSTLVVDEANATVEYGLTVTDDEGSQIGSSGPYDANETIANETIALEPPLEENTTLDVTVVSTGENGLDDGEVLENESVEYTVEPDDAPESFAAEFPTCSQAEVTGSLEDGDRIIVATTFYESGGIGNSLGEYSVTVGDDIDAPLEEPVVFEVGEDFAVSETDEGPIVEIPGGDFGAAIVGFSSPDATPGSIDYANPNASECVEEVRPERPELAVEDTTPTDDGIEVTFGYDNPNDADLVVESELEGTTDDQPPTELEPGSNSFTVDWTPEDDDERLAWIVDMGFYDYDEPIVVETDPAGEIDPTEPAAFAVDILEPTEPVEQGEDLPLEVDVENVGEEAGEQSIDFEVDGTTGSNAVSLTADESETVSFVVETDDLEPGEYDATVSSENDSDTATVTIESPPEETGAVDQGVDDGENVTGEVDTSDADESTADNGIAEDDEPTEDDGTTEGGDPVDGETEGDGAEAADPGNAGAADGDNEGAPLEEDATTDEASESSPGEGDANADEPPANSPQNDGGADAGGDGGPTNGVNESARVTEAVN